MYHVGRLFGINLRKEILMLTIIGIWNIIWCILWPRVEFWDYVDARKPPWRAMHPHTLYRAKYLWRMSRFFAVDPTLEEDDDSFVVVFEAWSLRLYLLSYILLLYPVIRAERGWLLAPWLCMAGVRVLTPDFLYRVYFWVLLFKYWDWLYDREAVQADHGEWMLESMKQAASIRRGRRRARGWRCHLLAMSTSELLRTVTDRDSSEENVNEDRQSRESKGQAIKQQTSEEKSEVLEEGVADDDDERLIFSEDFFEPEVQLKQLSTFHPDTKGTIDDCVVRQFNNFILNMASASDQTVADIGLEVRYPERYSFLSSFALPSPNHILAADACQPPHLGSDCSILLPLYPPPKYLSEYPGIFFKNHMSTLRLSEWNRHLYLPFAVDRFNKNLLPEYIDVDTLKTEEPEIDFIERCTKEKRNKSGAHAKRLVFNKENIEDEIIEYKGDGPSQDELDDASVLSTVSDKEIGIQVSTLSKSFIEAYEKCLKERDGERVSVTENHS